ncbi:CRE-HUM-2 protein, partial [Aphelenchoides avenae]
LREESLEIRSLLASHFERQTASGQDSGAWSGSPSDDGSASPVHSELDEQITQDRLVRHLRQLLDLANRDLAERDEEIMRLESRLHTVH